MGERLKNPPKIFHVNWFRTGDDGKFLWPGFGENLRVLKWIIERCENGSNSVETPLGYIPKKLDTSGLDISPEALLELFKIDRNEWQFELKNQKEFLDRFKEHLPEEIWNEYHALIKRMSQ